MADEHVFTVVCAWCHRIITAAPRSTPVTHTICPSCLDWTLTHEHLCIGDSVPDADPFPRPPVSIDDTVRH